MKAYQKHKAEMEKA